MQTAQETKLIEAGIPTPFSWANLWYEPEIYEATPLPVLIDFVRFQRSVLEKANVMTGPGWWIDVNGERAQLRKDLVLETLPGEILVTQSVLTRKTLEEIERQDAEGTGETVQPTEEAARMPGEAF